uniref:Uncharacterized protein n=1 Tax=Meloidogyne hapla TaxID=6305 RepID=A0A1I8BT60_MELHA
MSEVLSTCYQNCQFNRKVILKTEDVDTSEKDANLKTYEEQDEINGKGNFQDTYSGGFLCSFLGYGCGAPNNKVGDKENCTKSPQSSDGSNQNDVGAVFSGQGEFEGKSNVKAKEINLKDKRGKSRKTFASYNNNVNLPDNSSQAPSNVLLKTEDVDTSEKDLGVKKIEAQDHVKGSDKYFGVYLGPKNQNNDQDKVSKSPQSSDNQNDVGAVFSGKGEFEEKRNVKASEINLKDKRGKSRKTFASYGNDNGLEVNNNSNNNGNLPESSSQTSPKQKALNQVDKLNGGQYPAPESENDEDDGGESTATYE